MIIHSPIFSGSVTQAESATVNLSGSFTGSFKGVGDFTGLVADSVPYEDVTDKPTLVSGSSQVSYPELSNIPAGIISSSAQIDVLFDIDGLVSSSAQVTILLPTGVVSGSSQVNADSVTNFDTNVKAKLDTDGVISGSIQVSYPGLSNIPAGIVSGSSQVNITTTTGTLDISSRTNLAVSDTSTIDMVLTGDTLSANAIGGVVSGSSQVVYTSLSSIPSGIVSGSTQVVYTSLSSIPTGIVSGSSQVNADTITNFDTNVKAKLDTDGVISGSIQVSYVGLSNIPAGIVSGSTQLTSLLPSGVVSGSTQIVVSSTTGFSSFSSSVHTRIATEKGRVDAILLASDADKDSFAEIVTLINSVDTANDTAFAGFVTSSNSAQAVQDGRLTSLETKTASLDSDNTTQNSRLTSLESATASLQGTDITITLTGDVTGTGTITNLGNVSFATTVEANSVTLGTDTTGNFVGTITAGNGIVTTGATTGEGISHTISVGGGVVSGSSQVVYTGLSSIPAGIVSGSTQIIPLLPTGVVSGSSQVNADTITNFDANVKDKLNLDLVVSGSASSVKTFLSLQNVTNESKATMFSSPTFTGTVSGVTATHVGLGNVTNESKATMFSSPTFTGTVSGVTATMVGLGNVTNESKATMFTSPTFTGTVVAPTPSANDSSTKVATTAYVQQELTDLIGNASTAFDTLGEISASLAADSGALDSLVTVVSGKLAKASNLSDLTDTSAARTNLGVAIGTNVQAFNSTLASVAGGTYSGDDSITTIGTVTAGSVTAILPTGVVSGSAQVSGLSNAQLTNSSITIGSTSTALGATSTTLAGLTSVSSTGFTGALTGNASTATTLQTARTIGGVSFNGSANINLPGVNTAGNQNTSGNAGTATTLATARLINGTSFNGSADITIANLVSGSSQVNADTITNFDVNVKDKLNLDLVVSGSTSDVKTFLSLQNVTNESKAIMFVSPTFTGTVSGVTSTMVGLGNVNNTSDANKPVSTAQQTALNAKLNINGAGVVSGSSQVNADTITNFDANVKTKLDADLVLSGSSSDVKTFLSLQNVTNESKATMFSSPTFTGTVSGVTSTMVGLGNVNNTSDANKPVSTAQQTALNLKLNSSAVSTFGGTLIDDVDAGTARTTLGLGNVTNESKATMFSSPTFTGTVSGVTATHIGLGNVTNESKGTMFTSPSLTGTPIAPTAAANTNSTQIATTAYVQQELTDLIGGANEAFDTLIEISASLAAGDSQLNTLVDGKLSKASNLSDLTDTSAARTNLGVAIGTNVQAFNSTLASVAGGTYSGDDSITLIGTVTAGSVTAILPTGVVSGSAQVTGLSNAQLTNSSTTIGTTAIALGATSTTLAGLTSVTSTGFTGALTGNASTATTLQTARTIGGVSFNGSANINLPGVNTAGNQNTSGNAGTVTTNANLTGDVTSVGNATTIGTAKVTNAMLAGSIANNKLTNSSTTIGTTAISLGASSTTLVGLTSVTSTAFTGSLSGNASTVTTNANLTGNVTSVGNATTIAAGVVTNAMLAGSIANNKLTNSTISGIALGSNLSTLTIGTGLSGTSYNGSGAVTIANTGVTSNVAGTGISVSGATGAVTITNSSPNATHTGDVTGATALTIANDVVTNAKAANMAVNTIKGRITAGTGDPEDLTAANIRTIINVANGATANTGTVTSVNVAAGTGLSGGGTVTTSGTITLNNAGVTSAVAGTGVSVSGATGAVTISIGQAVATSSNVQFNSIGIGMAASATAGRIDATNDVVAFSSSDIRFKENITPIENALDKISKINGYTYDWKEENKIEHGYDGNDVGVIAQEIEEILPQLVQTRESGFKAVKYDKLVALLIAGMKEQQLQIEELKSRLS